MNEMELRKWKKVIMKAIKEGAEASGQREVAERADLRFCANMVGSVHWSCTRKDSLDQSRKWGRYKSDIQGKDRIGVTGSRPSDPINKTARIWNPWTIETARCALTHGYRSGSTPGICVILWLRRAVVVANTVIRCVRQAGLVSWQSRETLQQSCLCHWLSPYGLLFESSSS